MFDVTEEEFYRRAFSRNIGLLTELEQQRLKNLRIGIPGLGGVGGIHIMTLARTGIGGFSLADFDTYEVENFNRQYGAFADTVGASKLETMTKEALRINPFLKINQFPNGIEEKNIDLFLEDIDIIVDSLDFFAIDWKRKLYDRAHEKGVYVISAGPIGYGCSIICFDPNSKINFSDHFDFNDHEDNINQQVKFIVGISPTLKFFNTFIKSDKLSLKNQSTPSLSLACQMSASMAACEVLKIALGRAPFKSAPFTKRFDPFLNKYYESKPIFGNKNYFQKLKIALISRRFRKQAIKSNEAIATNVPPKLSHTSDLSESDIQYLLSKAVLAPSGDNSQHWQFSINDNQINLCEDKSRSNFNYSVEGLAQYLSHGAVAENIAIAASGINKNALIDFQAKDLSADIIAKFNINNGSNNRDHLLDFLEHRHTNRNKYSTLTISSKVKNKLAESYTSFPGIKIHLLDSAENLAKTVSLATLGDRFIWQTRNLHLDLFRWMRFDNKSEDGLAKGTLGLSLHEAIMLPHLRHWKLVQILNFLGFSQMISLKTNQLMKSSPLHAVVTVPNNTLKDYFNAGRAAERFWITANSLGLSMQPMTSAVMILHHELYGSNDGFNEGQIRLKKEVAEKWANLIELDKEIPVMMFRMGIATQAVQLSKRRSFYDFIIKKPD